MPNTRYPRHPRSLAALLLLILPLAAAAQTAAPPPPTKPVDSLHAWVGLKDPASLDNWVRWHIAEEQRLVAEMLAVKGPRTVENTLLPYDRAQMHLTLAGNQTGIMFSTNANKSIRDKAQELVQLISAETTKVSLNQDIYHALVAVNVSAANPATKHYMDRTLLEYRLGGVDKDQATRDKVKQLEDRITEIVLKFSRNLSDDVRKIPVTDKSELDGLPADYITRHTPAADGTITLTTDSPDATPVLSLIHI